MMEAFMDALVDAVQEKASQGGRRVLGGLNASSRKARGLPTTAKHAKNTIYNKDDYASHDEPERDDETSSRPVGFSARHALGAPVTAKHSGFSKQKAMGAPSQPRRAPQYDNREQELRDLFRPPMNDDDEERPVIDLMSFLNMLKG